MKDLFENLKSGSKLSLLKNNYAIFSEDAHGKDIAVSNHDGGTRYVFCELCGKKDISLDLGGSVLEINGRIIPFLLTRSKNVTLKNFTVKFTNRYYLQTEIKGINGNSLILDPYLKENVKVKDGALFITYKTDTFAVCGTFYVQELEKDGKVARNAGILVCNTQKDVFSAENGLIRLTLSAPPTCKTGNLLCVYSEPRVADAILIDDCKNVTLKNITILSSPAMGIMCQNSENVTLNGIKVVREKGDNYVITTLADATHFFACRKKVTVKNCVFENMNDDAVNVHGIYQVVISVAPRTVITEIKNVQQFGCNSFKKGDVLAFLDSKTKSVKCRAKVVVSEKIAENRFKITLNKNVTANISDLTENLSANPKIFISGSATGNNRPRGFLVSSRRKTVIKKCEFYNSECGIGVFADSDYWFESGAVKNVKIVKNRFFCNYGGGKSAITVTPSVPFTGKYFNKKIAVKNNVFDLAYGRAVVAENTQKIVLSGNVYLNKAGGENTFLNCKKATDDYIKSKGREQ